MLYQDLVNYPFKKDEVYAVIVKGVEYRARVTHVPPRRRIIAPRESEILPVFTLWVAKTGDTIDTGTALRALDDLLARRRLDRDVAEKQVLLHSLWNEEVAPK